MSSKDIVIVVTQFGLDMQHLTEDVVMALFNSHIPRKTTDNLMASNLASMHKAMVEFMIHSNINSQAKKNYDNSKKKLDDCLVVLKVSNSVEGGEDKVLWSNETFKFSKKKNADGSQISAKDLTIELQRLGVEPDLIAKAVIKATKVKQGNTYYTVEAS